MQSRIDPAGWIRSFVRIIPGDPHMTIARAHLVDPAVTRWYHCVTRCVRRAFLLGEEMHDRKSWIEHRLEELAEIFAMAVAGFAILDNHLHLLVRLDPDVAWGWSDEDVVRRWGRLFPPRDKGRQVAPVSEELVQARLKDARWVATARAVAKPELVHEVLEGAALTAGQPRGADPRRVLRGPVQERGDPRRGVVAGDLRGRNRRLRPAG